MYGYVVSSLRCQCIWLIWIAVLLPAFRLRTSRQHTHRGGASILRTPDMHHIFHSRPPRSSCPGLGSWQEEGPLPAALVAAVSQRFAAAVLCCTLPGLALCPPLSTSKGGLECNVSMLPCLPTALSFRFSRLGCLMLSCFITKKILQHTTASAQLNAVQFRPTSSMKNYLFVFNNPFQFHPKTTSTTNHHGGRWSYLCLCMYLQRMYMYLMTHDTFINTAVYIYIYL